MKKSLRVLLFIGAAAWAGQVMALQVNSYPSITDFEATTGPWEIDPASTTDWWWGSDYYITVGAYQGNYYAFVDTWDYSQVAIMTATFDLSAVSDPTISFAYHLAGAVNNSIGLEVSLDDGVSWDSIWAEAGDHGSLWQTTNISLSAYAGETNVMLHFRAFIGSVDYNSDLALDYIVVQGTTAGDADGDGMPNDWEELYFGGPTNGVPTGNPDSDHYNNLQEYIAGLNPTVSDGLHLMGMNYGADKVFQWTPVAGRVYSIYWTDNLASGFSLLQDNLTSGSFSDAVHGGDTEGYYKLEVQLAP